MILWVLDNLKLTTGDSLVIAFNPSWMCLSEWMKEVVGTRYSNVHLVHLPGPTRGAAETVLLALKGIPEQDRDRPIMLCDGDAFYTHDIVGSFRDVASSKNASFVFHDTQPNPIYSYCRLGSDNQILETKEKIKISDWANSGCYCFRNGNKLLKECSELLQAGETQLSQDKAPEYYTSGVIARMLAQSEIFLALKIPKSDINVLGTPAQVQEWCKSRSPPGANIAFSFSTLQRPHILEFCKAMCAQGHTIHILAKPDCVGEAAEWLSANKVSYHQLIGAMEESCDFLVRYGAVDPLLGALDKQVGYYAGGQEAMNSFQVSSKGLSGGSSFGGLSFMCGVAVGAVLALSLVKASHHRT